MMNLTDRTPVTLNWWRIILVAAVVLFVGSSIGAIWLVPEQAETNVIEDWNATIAKLGIDPVFPPEEDVEVGDVFAVLDDHQGHSSSPTALALRSIKIAHQDLTSDIQEAFSNSYLFPDTPPRPKDPNEPLEQTAKPDGILSHPTARQTLPLAAFPGFTIKQQRQVRGGLLGWLSSTFRFESDHNVELDIPVAETYGIPSLIALGELEHFCSDPKYPNRCAELTLRTHLSYVTPHAFEEIPPSASGTSNAAASSSETSQHLYKYPVEVVLINRVYLARYIDQSVRNAQGAGSTIKPGNAPSNGSQKNERKDDSEGAKAETRFASDDTQVLKQTFLRPLVIGFRAVRRVPKDVDANVVTSTRRVKECPSSAPQNRPEKDCLLALGSEPPPTINANQPPGADTQLDTDDPRRFRLYLHKAGQDKAKIDNLEAALKNAGYAIQGDDDLRNDDPQAGYNGAGVDYFNSPDAHGAKNVSKIVSDAFGASVPRRRKNSYNPVGVLGIWLPAVPSGQATLQ
jgi:hypothetical protein